MFSNTHPPTIVSPTTAEAIVALVLGNHTPPIALPTDIAHEDNETALPVTFIIQWFQKISFPKNLTTICSFCGCSFLIVRRSSHQTIPSLYYRRTTQKKPKKYLGYNGAEFNSICCESSVLKLVSSSFQNHLHCFIHAVFSQTFDLVAKMKIFWWVSVCFTRGCKNKIRRFFTKQNFRLLAIVNLTSSKDGIEG